MNPDPGPTRIRIQVIIIYLWITDWFEQRRIFELFFLYFPLIFVDNNLINHSKTWPFLIISLCNSSDLSLKWKRFFFAVLGWYFALGSGSLDPHIFADPDPASQMLRIERIRILSTFLVITLMRILFKISLKTRL